jgi:hypothetical protein
MRGDGMTERSVDLGRPTQEKALVDAALNILDFWEMTGCHCLNCEDRLYALRKALDPFLPTADDVRGILAERPR